VLLVALVTALLGWLGQRWVTIDSDLTSTIPSGDPLIEGSRRLLQRHPVSDRIVLDLSVPGQVDRPRLLRAADALEQRLRQSGAFAQVGFGQAPEALAGLDQRTASALPLLFDRRTLHDSVAPRLTEAAIRESLQRSLGALSSLEGVGRTATLQSDPLGLRGLALGRLSALSPKKDARIDSGHLFSADGQHLLLSALPHRVTGDPQASRRLAGVVQESLAAVQSLDGPGAVPLHIVTAGSYRVAADNEQILRGDTLRSVWWVTAGIGLVLLLVFSRPALGLLSLLPAGAGIAAAQLLYGRFEPRLSALAIGFGAALVSNTVDQGLMFLTFADRHRDYTPRRIAQQLLSSGWLATITTAGAFLALRWSGYPLLAQLGTFAALGMLVSYFFVQLVMPLMFRRAPGPGRAPWLPMDRWMAALDGRAGRVAMGTALLVLLALTPFARPHFSADLLGMSTVSAETRAAEAEIRGIWGDLFTRAYLFVESPTLEQLQQRSDVLAGFLEEQREQGAISGGLSPSELLPGSALAAEHLRAWQEFWTAERQEAVRAALTRQAEELGFTADAFAPFLAQLTSPRLEGLPLDELTVTLLGGAPAKDGRGWVLLTSVERLPGYDASRFAEAAAARGLIAFDGPEFRHRLERYLGSAFGRMMLIAAGFVILCVALASLDWVITLVMMAPVFFGLLATLGVLGLMGKPIGLPGIMLGIIVFGMGIDFSVHLVHVAQRFPNPNADAHVPVRLGVVLASSTTLVGMATLAFARHEALRGAGLSGLLAVGFTALFALALVPPVMAWLLPQGRRWPEGVQQPAQRRRLTLARYRHLDAHPRLFARFKLALDPMFERLDALVGDAEQLVDLGAGHGLQGAWLLSGSPRRFVRALEPDPDRASVARWVLGERGHLTEAALPTLPDAPPQDVVLLLDVAHYLDDETLGETLGGVFGLLRPGGRLLLRDTVPGRPGFAWERVVEATLMRLRRQRAHFRPRGELQARLEAVGFHVQLEATPGREETWFIATRPQ